MSRPEVDFSDLEIAEAQLREVAAESEEKKQAWLTLRDSLTPGQRELLLAYLNIERPREWAIGALAALKPLRRERHEFREREAQQGAAARAELRALERQIRDLTQQLESVQTRLRATTGREAAVITIPQPDRATETALRADVRRLTKEVEQLRKKPRRAHEVERQLRRQNALINRLFREIKDAETMREIEAAYADVLPDPPASPDWDYKPVSKRRPSPSEVVTEAPFIVGAAADQIEALVRARGQCTKPEVSAALPDDLRPHLAVAYKHLHAARRVRVDGWKLSLWT